MDETNDAPDDTSTTAQVDVGGSFTGTISNADDVDYVAVELQGGVEYVIDLEGSATGGGSLADPEILGIRDASDASTGISGDDDDGIGLNSRVVFSPETTGTYYLQVASADGEDGSYTLSVNYHSSGDQEKNTVATTASADGSGTYTGTFEYYEDRDWIAVTLEEGERYIVELDGVATTDYGIESAMIYGIYDAAGQLIDNASGINGISSGRVLLAFEPSADGVYYISVSNKGALDPDEDYSLTVRHAISGSSSGEFLKGRVGGDFIHGGGGDDQIYAGPGDIGADQFFGGAGNDTIGGGAGDDRIVGDEVVGYGAYELDSGFGAGGADVLFGGSGNDTLVGGGWMPSDGQTWVASTFPDSLWGGPGNDVILAASGADQIGGGTGNDYLDGWGGDDTIYGGPGDNGDKLNDVILGGQGDDLIFAGPGDDYIEGEDGNDEIFNGPGDDAVGGGYGNDTLWGGPGDDLIWGQEGADIFAFAQNNGNDVINDFAVGQDILDLSEVSAQFASLSEIEAASSITTVSGYSGVLIDTGGGSSVFLLGLSLADLGVITIVI